MVLVIGLGNPGKNYEKTRHNIGFRLIDALVRQCGAHDVSKQNFKGELYKEAQNLFLKPTTFMNLSGESASLVISFYKPSRILTIHDDLDLPFGTIRLKRGGGHGGHNGLKSLDKHIGSDYYRLRFGIGKPPKEMEVSDYVLAKFLEQEESKLASKLMPHALLAVDEFIKMQDESTWDRIVSRYTLSVKSTKNSDTKRESELDKPTSSNAKESTSQSQSGESKCR